MRELDLGNALFSNESDKPRDHCAVFGLISFAGRDVSSDVVLGLASLQHRGQDGAGIASFHPYAERFAVYKQLGLVNDVFNNQAVLESNQLASSLAIGHTRYATSGTKGERQSLQPHVIEWKKRSLTIAHNGNIPTDLLESLRAELPGGLPRQPDSDTEVLGWRIMLTPGRSWKEKIQTALQDVHGGFALTIATDENELIGVRDRLSNRPLVLGYTDDGIALASETHGFERLKVKKWEEVKGGEMVVASNGQVEKYSFLPTDRTARCIVEPIYFAHPLSKDNGFENWEIRHRIGENLAKEYPMRDVDIICGVPEGGTDIANGYAAALGRRTDKVIVKDRYGNGIRTFIQESAVKRERAIDAKFSVSNTIKGKSIVVAEDSVVRAATVRILAARLREKGAREIIILSGSPPFIDRCDLGVDIATEKELIAVREENGKIYYRSRKEIAQLMGVNFIGYLSLDGLIDATGRRKDTFCTHCLTSEHPIFDAHALDKKK